MTQTPSPLAVHLVGSVPLSSADEVFRQASAILGPRLAKIPDGETGYRRNWINFQYAVLARNPLLDFDGPPIDIDALVQERGGQGAEYKFTQLRLREGASASSLDIDALGYAEHAIRSHARFAVLQREGVIAPQTRFQVSLPTPLAPMAMFIAPRHLPQVYPAYALALQREVARLIAEIPHEQLAIQWDVAVEFALWEGLFPPPPGDWRAMLLDQLAQLATFVPSQVQLGYHFCYGDRGHKHFIQPKDTGNLVAVARGLLSRLCRPFDWLHIPVPRDRDDAGYFAPLSELSLPAETKLFLGLVHYTDGVEGARRRIAAARRVVNDFGIGTECGLGRRDPSSILDLLRLHAQVSSLGSAGDPADTGS
jgi:hypothetical protein